MAAPPTPAPTPTPTPAPVAVTWSAADRSPTMTLDVTRLIATSTAASPASVRATAAAPAGLWQAEVIATTASPTWAVGLATKAFPLSNGGGLGNDNMGIGFYLVDPKQSVWEAGAALTFGAANSQPDVSGATAGLVSDGVSLWVTSDAMNAAFAPPPGVVVYNNDPAADPLTKAGGLPLSGLAAGDRFLTANTLDAGAQFTLNGKGPFKWPVAGAAPYAGSAVPPPPPPPPSITHVTVAAKIAAADKAMTDAMTAANAALTAAQASFAAAMASALADLATLKP